MKSRIPVLLGAALLAGTGLLWAQAAPPPPPPPAAPAAPAAPMPCMMHGDHPGGPMPEDCKAMMTKRQAMTDEMKAMDAKLDALVKAMNDARGAKKVDATAAVVAELVAQRKTMRATMETMQPMMMQHMMKHMQAGMMHGAAESMGGCPMMDEMGAEHGDHHPQPH